VEDADAEADADAVLDEDATSCCLNTAIQTRAFPQVEVFLTSPEPEASSATTDTSSASATTARGRSLQSAKSAKSADEPAVSKGYGLKICEAISRGTIIVEYLGEVITAAECLRRMKSYSQHDAFYFAGLDNGLMLDAKAMGSVARFANHSCAPTCLLQKWTVQGECRLVLVAGRDMQAGEEVSAL
jgi:SET domain-containing protein